MEMETINGGKGDEVRRNSAFVIFETADCHYIFVRCNERLKKFLWIFFYEK
jgi:hypothetical protein